HLLDLHELRVAPVREVLGDRDIPAPDRDRGVGRAGIVGRRTVECGGTKQDCGTPRHGSSSSSARPRASRNRARTPPEFPAGGSTHTAEWTLSGRGPPTVKFRERAGEPRPTPTLPGVSQVGRGSRGSRRDGFHAAVNASTPDTSRPPDRSTSTHAAAVAPVVTTSSTRRTVAGVDSSAATSPGAPAE